MSDRLGIHAGAAALLIGMSIGVSAASTLRASAADSTVQMRSLGLPAPVSAILQHGVSNLFNLDLPAAEQQFAAVAVAVSNHAAGHVWQALGVFVRMLVEGPSSADEAAMTGYARLALAAPAPAPGTDGWREFYDAIAALLLARDSAERHGPLETLGWLRNGVAAARRALTTDAAAADDAAMLVGAYQFFGDYLPWYLRMPAALMIEPTDRHTGLRRLEQARQRAVLCAPAATLLTAAAYAWADEPDAALRLCDVLQSATPGNHLVDGLRAYILAREGRIDDAYRTLTSAVVRLEHDQRSGVRALLADQYYELGRLALAATNYHDARVRFESAARLSGRKLELRAWSALQLGVICDLLRERANAQRQYAIAAATAADASVVKRYAATFLRTPYAGQCLE